MSRFVQYTEFGGPEILTVVEVPTPSPGPGEALVRVHAAGLNPVDYKIFHGGPAAAAYGAHLPSGVGNDYAGIVEALGEGVTTLSVGDAVLGGARNLAVADYVVAAADTLVPKPEALPFEVAGSLSVAARTAAATVRYLALTAADTVLVSAAAGGVGVLAVQLARRAGATVVGTASEANHAFLTDLGVIPVAYGDGLVERLREAAPQGYTAALDTHGPDTISAALELGIPIERIVTIAAYGDAAQGAAAVGGAQATPTDLAEVAQLLADGEIQLPIEATYPIEQVRAAYEHLLTGHLRGKIVITTT